jgi:hypothetical protein
MNRLQILLLIVCCGCTSTARKLALPEKPLPPKARYCFEKPFTRADEFDFEFDDNEKAWSLTIFYDFAMDTVNGRTRSEVLAFSFKPNVLRPPLHSGPNPLTNLLQQVNALVARYQGSNIVQAIETHTHKRIFTKYSLDSRVRKTEIEDSREYTWIRTAFTGKRTCLAGDNPRERLEWILYVTNYNPDRLGEIDCPLVVIALEMPLDVSSEDHKHLVDVLERSVRNITFYR